MYNNEEKNKKDRHRKVTEIKVILPAENMDTKHNEHNEPQSTANKTIDKRKIHR